MVACLWALLVSTSIGGLESGEGLLNRGAASEADTSVERKVARRIRKHATRQLVSEETALNEVESGTGIVTRAVLNDLRGVVGRYQQTLNGLFSAVSKQIFASKY